jgi:acetyltransferase-like isoleucine patch superfamily enzyme
MDRIRHRLGRLLHRLSYVNGPRLASALRKRWVLLRHPQANIVFNDPVYLGPGFSLHIPADGTFIAGAGTEFRRNFRAEISGNGRLVVGERCAFTYDVLIQCSTTIEFGDGCGVGQSCFVADGKHRYRDISVPFLQQGYDHRPIHVGDEVMILSKVTIVADVGDHCVIGANAVVNRDIPAYCVAAGVPATVRDYFGPPGEAPPELSASQEEKNAPAGA